MKRFFFVVMLALSVLAMGLPASTRAADVTQYQFSGEAAEARFVSVDGCIERVVGIGARNEQEQQSGQPEQSSFGFVSIFETNVCSNSDGAMMYGEATLPPGALHIRAGLKSATLNTTIEVVDYSLGTRVPVTINATWTATGASDFQRHRTQTSMRGWRLYTYNRGTTNYAQVSGTVMMDGHNLTPQAGEGRIISAKEIVLEMSR